MSPPRHQPQARARAIATATLFLGLILGGTGCPARPATNVLLISVDSLRTDHVHALGYARETTPTLDRLIAEGTAWTGVVAPAPWTTPSMMSVMTGLQPDVHHVEEDDRVLPPDVTTLAERFKRAGSATGAFVPSATLTARFGFARGFDDFDERDFGHRSVTSPAQASSVIHWLEGVQGPFFAWVHLWDPHYNYNPSPPYDTRFSPKGGERTAQGAPAGQRRIYDMIALKGTREPLSAEEIAEIMAQYDGEIALTDAYIGEVLEALRGSGRLDDTIVVVLGDHGEAFQEHGWLTHTNTVYEETVRVPVIVRWPGRVPAGRRVDSPRNLIGITEAIAVWAGLPPERNQSRSLSLDIAPAPSGSAVAASVENDDLVVSATRRQATVLAARRGKWSLVLEYRTCTPELYDLEADPAQGRDLAAEQPETLSKMKSHLKTWLERGRHDHALPIMKLQEEDPEHFEKLGALGYADLFGDRLGARSEADPLGCL